MGLPFGFGQDKKAHALVGAERSLGSRWSLGMPVDLPGSTHRRPGSPRNRIVSCQRAVQAFVKKAKDAKICD